MIYVGSRYEVIRMYKHFQEVKGGEIGINTIPRRDLEVEKDDRGISHQWKLGDRIDILAARYYGDEQLWWVIMDANPRYLSSLDIKIGDVLAIPTSIPKSMRGGTNAF